MINSNKLKVIFAIFVFIIIIFAITNHISSQNIKPNEPIKNNDIKINKSDVKRLVLYKPSKKIEVLPNVFLTVLETNEDFRTNIDHKQLKDNDKVLRINLNIVNNSKYDTHIGEFRCKTDNNIVLTEFFQQYNKKHKIKPNDIKDLSLYYIYNDDKQKVNGVTLIYDNKSLVKPDIFDIEIDFNPLG